MALSDKISNIIGVPIPDVINEQLQLRSQMNSLETRDIDNIRYLENKTAWVRLISSVNLTEQADIRYFNKMGLNINLADPASLAKQFVLFGGTSAYTKNKQGYYYAQKSGILGGEGFSPAYSPFGTKEIQDYGYRPMPGIMDVNIDSQGRMGSVRSAKINFKCWDKYQLDVIDTLYFRLGFMMFLEWGNTYFYNKNKSGQVELQSTEAYSTKIDPFKPGLYKEEIISRISRLNRETAGNYDAMLGMVSNFSFSMNQEGGYDCNLTLISLGILAESIKINTFSSGNNVLNIALDTYNKNLESASLNEAVKSISSGSDFQLSKLSPQNLVPTLIQLKDKPAVITYKYIYPSNITAKNTITTGPPQSANKPAEDVPNVNVYFNTREGGSSIERTFLRIQGVVIPHNNAAVVEIDANAVNQLNTNQSFQIDVNRLKEVLSRSTYSDGRSSQPQKIDPNDLSAPIIARLANTNSPTLQMNYTGANDGQYYIQFTFQNELEHIVKSDESGVIIDDTVKASLTKAGITSYKKIAIDPGFRDYVEFFGTEITDDVIEYKGKTSAQAFKDTMDLFYAALQKNRYSFAISGDNYYFKVLIERPLTAVVEVKYTNESDREVTVDKPITMNYVFPLVVKMNDSYLIKDGSVNPGDATQPSSGKEPAPDPNAVQGATAEAATAEAANNPNPDQTSQPQTVSSEATQEPLSVMSTLEASLFAIKVFGLDKTRDKKLNDPLGARVEKVSFVESTTGESFHSNLFANGVFSSFINELIEGTISDSRYEDPSIGKLEKLKIAAKYGFATNLLTGFTKIREAGANNFYPVNYQDLMNCYVFAYEFDPSGLDLGTKTEKPVYITLGTLLMMLNSNCTIYDTTDKSAQTPLIYIDFNPYHNLCLSCPQHLSVDPWTAMINFEGGDKGYASIFPPEILEQAPNGSILIKAGAPDQESTYLFRPSAVGVQTNGDRVSGFVPSFHIPGPLSDFDSIKEPATISNFQGYIMNIMLNVDYLAKIVREEASRSDENKVFLKSFIEQILVDLNKCLGNFNTFRMSYNDGANCIQIIDDQLIPTSGQRQLSNKTNSDLPLFGRASIAKSLEIKTEISTRLSNMIAISANSGVKTANGNDASSYGFMNKKLQDRYVGDRSNIKPQAAENQETGPTAEEQQLQTEIMIQAAVQFNSTIKSIYGPSANPSKDAVDAATNYYAEQLSYFKAVEPTIQGANMIPVSVNFSTDGISGLAMGHAFTVPDQILPYVYSTRKLDNDGSLRKVGFVIKSLSNSIRSNTWTTAVTSDMIFLKDNSSITAAPVLYIPSNLTGSVVDETKTKNERGEYAIWDEGQIKGYEPIVTIQEGGFAANVVKKYEAPFRELQRAAKAAGHNLYLNSGFRTFSEQLELRRKHCKNPARKSDIAFLRDDRGDGTNFHPLTVRPGYSPHQRGTGFDFVVKGRIPLFKWLEENAWKYSFYRVVPSERWHWNYKPELAKTKENTYHKVGRDHISWKQEDF